MIDVTMVMPVERRTDGESVRSASEEKGLFTRHFIREDEMEKRISQNGDNLPCDDNNEESELAKVARDFMWEIEAEGENCWNIGDFPFFFLEAPTLYPMFLEEQHEISELLQSISQQMLMEMEPLISKEEQDFVPLSESTKSLLNGEMPCETLPQFSIVSEGIKQLKEDVNLQHIKGVQHSNEEIHVEIIDLQMGHASDEGKQSDEQSNFSLESFGATISSLEKPTTTVIYEKAKLNEVANKLQQKIEYLQKFVVKTDKAFIELNPEHLGKIDVLMQKNGGKLLIEVTVYEPLAKVEVEMIFEELRTRLQEAAIEFQLGFTEKESKEQTNKEKPKQKTKDNETTSMFAEILEGDTNV